MLTNICTVSDINYLLKGMTLYESLKTHTSNFILHYLCIDQKSYDKLKQYECDSLIAYNVQELLDKDPILLSLKNTNYRYFCWCLASYFTNYLLKTNNKDFTYIDADIYFHGSVDEILNAIGEAQVGIFRHRQFDLNSNPPEGKFNVGVVHFKSKKFGIKISEWWSDAVLNMKYPNFATCGDQKYLDNFLNMCPNESIFCDGEIGHGAPWQWQLYDFSEYEETGNIIWNNKKQKLLFSHFSQFDFKDNFYIPSTMHYIYTPLKNYEKISGLKNIYDEYFNKLKEAKIKYNG